MYRFIVVFLLGFILNGCILLVEDDYHRSGDYTYYYDYVPYILDAGWECTSNIGSGPNDWTFWARADDGDGYWDLSHIFVRVTSLVDYGDVKEFVHNDSIDGYFSVERSYYYPECGDPVDVEFIIYDFDSNSESYILYW